jgi:predicted ribosomally synthesized peptide with SipW-like signal peptide
MNVRRPLLTTIAALGGVITLAGTTGVFAVFTDRATTGTNSFATKGLSHAADLKIAAGTITVGETAWTVDCGTYVDDLETGLITMTDASPTDGFSTDYVCVKNAGSQTVDVTSSAIDVTDLDTGCTGDEAAVDTTCGVDETTLAPQAGELSPLLTVGMVKADCNDANQGGSGVGTVASMSGATVATLAPGEVKCVKYSVDYVATQAEAQTAQSDTVTWRFAFDGTVPTT